MIFDLRMGLKDDEEKTKRWRNESWLLVKLQATWLVMAMASVSVGVDGFGGGGGQLSIFLLLSFVDSS